MRLRYIKKYKLFRDSRKVYMHLPHIFTTQALGEALMQAMESFAQPVGRAMTRLVELSLDEKKTYLEGGEVRGHDCTVPVNKRLNDKGIMVEPILISAILFQMQKHRDLSHVRYGEMASIVAAQAARMTPEQQRDLVVAHIKKLAGLELRRHAKDDHHISPTLPTIGK